MASFLMFCTSCGVYMKGSPLLLKELGKHKCDSNPQQMNESIAEFKAILDTLTKKGFPSNDEISKSAAAYQIAPPNPPPPPYLDSVFCSVAEQKAIQEAAESYAKVQIELKEKLLKRKRDVDDERENVGKRCRERLNPLKLIPEFL